jgi:SAM-dependent methyltransferase
MIDVPEKYIRNAAKVLAMGPPAKIGARLIRYMCERLGIPDLRDTDVLDLGCGTRFAESFILEELPVKSYTGIDVDKEMIGFLADQVTDPRLRFCYWNAHNPAYNPCGFPLSAETGLPSGDQTFDVICMFSVITHQLPPDAEVLFHILLRQIRPAGRMFFSVNIQDMDEDYRELDPRQATASSAYSLRAITDIVERTGWHVLTIAGKNPEGLPIMDSFLCAPS